MKTKTILELLTLSSSIYVLARDTHLLEKINEFSEKSKEHSNKTASESELNENGNEREFLDKIILKTHDLKEELNARIEALAIQFYKKIKVAHLDEIKSLNENIKKLENTVALLEAKLNKLDIK